MQKKCHFGRNCHKKGRRWIAFTHDNILQSDLPNYVKCSSCLIIRLCCHEGKLLVWLHVKLPSPLVRDAGNDKTSNVTVLGCPVNHNTLIDI